MGPGCSHEIANLFPLSVENSFPRSYIEYFKLFYAICGGLINPQRITCNKIYYSTYIHVSELGLNFLACTTKSLKSTHPFDLYHVTLSWLTRLSPQDIHDLSVDFNCGEQLLKAHKIFVSHRFGYSFSRIFTLHCISFSIIKNLGVLIAVLRDGWDCTCGVGEWCVLIGLISHLMIL